MKEPMERERTETEGAPGRCFKESRGTQNEDAEKLREIGSKKQGVTSHV